MDELMLLEHPVLISEDARQKLTEALCEVAKAAAACFTEVWQRIVETLGGAIRDAVEVAVKAIADFMVSYAERYAEAAAAHPKWYHLSRLAKKRRTRKKWKNALCREAFR